MISTIIQSRHHWPVLRRGTNRFSREGRASRLVLLETFQPATQALVVLLLLDMDLIYLVSHKLHLVLQLTENRQNHFRIRLFSLSGALSRTRRSAVRIKPHWKRRTFRHKRRERHRMRGKPTSTIRRRRKIGRTRRHHRRHGREESMTVFKWEWSWRRRRRRWGRHLHP